MSNKTNKYSLDEIHVRLKNEDASKLLTDESIDNPATAVKLLGDYIKDLDQEHFMILNLNSANEPINFSVATMKAIDHAGMDIRNLFKSTVSSNASKVMVLHNHPNEHVVISDSDKIFTTNIYAATQQLNLEFVDHVVVSKGAEEIYSFRENGLLKDIEDKYEESNLVTEKDSNYIDNPAYKELQKNILEWINREYEQENTEEYLNEDPEHIGLAFTTFGKDEHESQAECDLKNLTFTHYFDGVPITHIDFINNANGDAEQAIADMQSYICDSEFNDLVYPNAEDLRLVMNLELDANDEVVPYKKPANEVVEDYKKEIAERFIELINKDESSMTWVKEWSTSFEKQRSLTSNIPYKGRNAFMLSVIAALKGYSDPRWVTFNGLRNFDGAHVKKGEKGVHIERWIVSDLTKKKGEKDKFIDFDKLKKLIKSGERDVREFAIFPKIFTVFNVEQCEGVPPLVEQEEKKINQEQYVTDVANGMKVKLLNDGGDNAYYSPFEDTVHLPNKNAFSSDYAYNATALHELGHATGSESRLQRNQKNNFGSQAYAFEELVAEMTSCLAASRLMPSDADMDSYIQEHSKNHLAYVKGWSTIIKNNPNAIEDALKQATLATDFMDMAANVITVDRFNELHKSEACVHKEDGIFSVENFGLNPINTTTLAIDISEELTQTLSKGRSL